MFSCLCLFIPYRKKIDAPVREMLALLGVFEESSTRQVRYTPYIRGNFLRERVTL